MMAEKFVWDQDRELTDEELESLEERRKKAGASQMLGAAMTAVGNIIDPSRNKVVVMAEVDDGDDPDGDLPPNLEFGKLPPL